MNATQIDKAIDTVFGEFPLSQLAFFQTKEGTNLAGIGGSITAASIVAVTGGSMADSTFGNYASTARTILQTNESLEGRPMEQLASAVRGWNASLVGLPPELRIVESVAVRSRGRQSTRAMSTSDIRGTLSQLLASFDDKDTDETGNAGE